MERRSRDYWVVPAATDGWLRIVCLGDSMMLGHSVCSTDALPPQLERRLQVRRPELAIEVVNRARSSGSLSSAWSAFRAAWQPGACQIVVLSISAGDARRRYAATLRDIAAFEAEHAVSVLLLFYDLRSANASIAEAWQAACTDAGVRFANALAYLTGPTSGVAAAQRYVSVYFSHPSPEVHAEVASFVAAELEAQGFLGSCAEPADSCSLETLDMFNRMLACGYAPEAALRWARYALVHRIRAGRAVAGRADDEPLEASGAEAREHLASIASRWTRVLSTIARTQDLADNDSRVFAACESVATQMTRFEEVLFWLHAETTDVERARSYPSLEWGPEDPAPWSAVSLEDHAENLERVWGVAFDQPDLGHAQLDQAAARGLATVYESLQPQIDVARAAIERVRRGARLFREFGEECGESADAAQRHLIGVLGALQRRATRLVRWLCDHYTAALDRAPDSDGAYVRVEVGIAVDHAAAETTPSTRTQLWLEVAYAVPRRRRVLDSIVIGLGKQPTTWSFIVPRLYRGRVRLLIADSPAGAESLSNSGVTIRTVVIRAVDPGMATAPSQRRFAYEQVGDGRRALDLPVLLD